MNDADLLDARNLHAYYGSSHVLQGVDFAIGSGEVVALMGRNGMGKTTLLRSLLGLPRHAPERSSIAGMVTTGFAPHRIARLGVAYVPENSGVFPKLSVRENLLMAARAASMGVKRGVSNACSRRFRPSPSGLRIAVTSFPAVNSRC